MTWSRERFVRFIEENLDDEIWSEPDPLYPNLSFPSLAPKKDNLRTMLGDLYRQRSAGSHEGQLYPSYVAMGTSPWITDEAIRAFKAAAESDRPPISWFERLVQVVETHMLGAKRHKYDVQS
jgi:hypothetical protein